MTLNNLIGKTLEKITVNPDTIRRLIVAAERNIADSKVAVVSSENRFDAAYKAPNNDSIIIKDSGDR
jgi:hypothetical protein